MAVAGSGSKTFLAGAKLLAAEVNGYLMKQSIAAFDTTAARDAAITSSAGEGMHAYIGSQDLVYYHDGTSWVLKEGWGTGSPEGLVSASVGAIWHRTNGAAGTALYVKEANTNAVGWTAFPSASGSSFAGCRLSSSVSTQTCANAAATVVNWNTETFDADGAHEGVTNPSRITIPAAWNGKYITLKGQVNLSARADYTRALIEIKKNGTIITTHESLCAPSASNPMGQAIEDIVVGATGDYYEIAVFQTNTATASPTVLGNDTSAGYSTFIAVVEG